MYYDNQKMAPFDATFQQQIGQMTMSSQITTDLARAISQCWENSKQQLVQQLDYQYSGLGGYNQQIISNSVNNFIVNTARSLIQNQMNYQRQMNMNMGMMPMQAPVAQPMGFGNSFGGAVSFPVSGQTQQPKTLYAEVDNTPVAKPVQKVETKEVIKPVVKAHEFVDPVIDEPDSVYGDKVVETSLGTIQVTSFRDGYGQPVKYVNINLTTSCFDENEAINRAKRLYVKDTTFHMDIEYSKLDKLPVPYDVFNEFVTEAKKFVISDPATKGNLKYLQGIQKLLNNYPRGIADTIDSYLCNRFNKAAGAACNTSMAKDKYELTVGKFASLIDLSNRDSANQKVQNWYKLPNFKEQFALACSMAIREFILNVKLIDPNEPENTSQLMRAYSGLTEADDLSLLDITKELFNVRSEFAIASTNDKKTKFGKAGKALMDSVVFVIGGQKLTITRLIPEGVVGINRGIPILMLNHVVFGGYDENNKPCEPDSLFEYFMVNRTMESVMYTDLVIEYKQAVIKYGCSRCVDGALIIKTER